MEQIECQAKYTIYCGLFFLKHNIYKLYKIIMNRKEKKQLHERNEGVYIPLI